MSIEQDKQRIEQLRKEILIHNQNYYQNNSPTISDSEYDFLFKELEKLEEKYPQFKSKNSPTQKVGGEVGTDFKEYKHGKPLLSLSNVYDTEQFENFVNKLINDEKFENIQLDYVLEPKFDGLAVNLVYENGILVAGATRGNGIIGENIFENIKTIKNIPQKIMTDLSAEQVLEKIEIRGEVIMPKKEFLSLNNFNQAIGAKTFSNARNAAAGSLRVKDPKITQARNLKFYPYAIGEIKGNFKEEFNQQIDTHFKFIQLCQKWGFDTVPNLRTICQKTPNMQQFFNEIMLQRADLPFDIDGIVCKINNFKLQEIIGEISRSPKWAIAYKFPAELAYTKLLNIDIQVGRTGVLTPVARLEPINIGGVVITNATLNNIDDINRKNVRVGDIVQVRRAADVIPEIVGSVLEKRPLKNDGSPFYPPFKMPDTCPCCKSKIVKEENSVAVRCSGNDKCSAQLKGKFKLFVSRAAMDIDGFGDKLVEQLVDKNILKDFTDIYKLKKSDLLKLDRFAEKSATKLLENIEKSKNVELYKFIYALGIRNVGLSTAKDLANYFEKLDFFQSDFNTRGTLGRYLKIKELTSNFSKNIGEITLKSIIDYFTNPKNQIIIDNLIHQHHIKFKNDLEINNKNDVKNNNLLQGLNFVITGSFNKNSSSKLQKNRDEIKAWLESMGANVKDNISKNINYLIAGEKAGSKLNKAQSLNIPILDDNQLLNLIDDLNKNEKNIENIKNNIENQNLDKNNIENQNLNENNIENIKNNIENQNLDKNNIENQNLNENNIENQDLDKNKIENQNLNENDFKNIENELKTIFDFHIDDVKNTEIKDNSQKIKKIEIEYKNIKNDKNIIQKEPKNIKNINDLIIVLENSRKKENGLFNIINFEKLEFNPTEQDLRILSQNLKKEIFFNKNNTELFLLSAFLEKYNLEKIDISVSKDAVLMEMAYNNFEENYFSNLAENLCEYIINKKLTKSYISELEIFQSASKSYLIQYSNLNENANIARNKKFLFDKFRELEKLSIKELKNPIPVKIKPAPPKRSIKKDIYTLDLFANLSKK